MFAALPDFTPRDPHSLWYPASTASSTPTNAHVLDANQGQSHESHNRQRTQVLERSVLARLAADEEYLSRRRHNIQNFGSGWIKPPGIPKTLHQMREEKREQDEHAEAMRREQLAQELELAEPGMPGMEGDVDGIMDDVQLDGAQDLDEDIPDADEGYGLSDDDEEDEEEDEEDDEDEEAVDDPEDEENASDREEASGLERGNDLVTAMMRAADDAYREALVRGDPDGNDMYGADEELEAEEEGAMFDEEDVVHGALGDDDDLGMDADLDDDIPEADSRGYEHTDSEVELSSDASEEHEATGQMADSSSDNDDSPGDIGFAPRAAPLGPPLSPTLQGRASFSGGRASTVDLSNLLSQDESSFMDNSPVQARMNR